MKSPSVAMNALAIFFIVLGSVWFSFIQSRCYEIAPRLAFSAAVSGSGSSTAEVEAVKKVRSPHAKLYHDLLFRAITVAEVFTSVFYILAGMFLLRRAVLTRFCVSLALWLHVSLMILVIGFMKFGAMPLSHLTNNPNLLQLYFLPSHKIHNLFAVAFNGFNFYLPGGTVYFFAAVLYFYYCFYVFARPEVKDYLSGPKKA